MEVKYRRVKVGFVFGFNSLISNYYAYDTVIIMYLLSQWNENLWTDSTPIVSFNASEQCLPVPWNDAVTFL